MLIEGGDSGNESLAFFSFFLVCRSSLSNTIYFLMSANDLPQVWGYGLVLFQSSSVSSASFEASGTHHIFKRGAVVPTTIFQSKVSSLVEFSRTCRKRCTCAKIDQVLQPHLSPDFRDGPHTHSAGFLAWRQSSAG